jgi:hypothetical protein
LLTVQGDLDFNKGDELRIRSKACSTGRPLRVAM